MSGAGDSSGDGPRDLILAVTQHMLFAHQKPLIYIIDFTNTCSRALMRFHNCITGRRRLHLLVSFLSDICRLRFKKVFCARVNQFS